MPHIRFACFSSAYLHKKACICYHISRTGTLGVIKVKYGWDVVQIIHDRYATHFHIDEYAHGSNGATSS